jgi:hypothetical protein
MRWMAPAVVALAAASLWTVKAEAQSPWYVEGSVGGYFRDSQSVSSAFFNEATPTVTVPGTLGQNFDTGILGNIGLGYRVAPHVRLEAEFGYVDYDTHTLTPTTAAAGFSEFNGQSYTRRSGADWSRYSGTVNAFYDFSPIAAQFTPYLGVGVGASSDRHTAGSFVSAAGQTFTGSKGSSSTDGLGFVEAGFSVPVAAHWAIVPAYRYVHYFGSNAEAANVAKVGLRYSF